MGRVSISGLPLDFPHSGTAVYLRSMIEWLPRVAPDLEFDLLLRDGSHPSTEAVESRSVRTPFHGLNRGRGVGTRLDKLIWEQATLPMAARLRSSQVVHVPYWAPPVLPMAPLVVTIHDVIPLVLDGYHRSRQAHWYTRLVSLTTRRANVVITVSEHSKRDIVRVLGISEDRIRVTPEAADARFQPGVADQGTLRKYGLTEEYVLYMGGSDRRKNVATLLRAWAGMHQYALKNGVFLVVVAHLPPPDALYPDLVRLAHELGIDQTLIFLDGVAEADKPDVYRGARMFCYPSLYEGFGLPPLEAMASGRPVVCSDASSLPEVVGNGGVCLSPLDVRAWTSTMMSVLNSSALSAELGLAGSTRAGTFSWRHTAEETAQSYRDLM